MMRIIPRLPPMLMLAALALAGPIRAEEAERMPFELVRSLRTIQDRIAHGDAAAHESQGQLMAEIAARLARVDAAAWNDPRNARAAVIYVLSGGDPAVLKRLHGAGALPGIEENLVKGVLAYSEGRSAEADLLLGIDTRGLDPTIGGHIALVQASITGSIIGNLLLVFGLSMFVGGLGRQSRSPARGSRDRCHPRRGIKERPKRLLGLCRR